LDHPRLANQLTSLERRASPGGRDRGRVLAARAAHRRAVLAQAFARLYEDPEHLDLVKSAKLEAYESMARAGSPGTLAPGAVTGADEWNFEKVLAKQSHWPVWDEI
jgi:hypothetical protein